MPTSAHDRDEIMKAIDQSAIVSMTDAKGIITHVNDAFCKISGYTRDELLGKDHRIVNSGTHSKDFFANIWKTIASGGVWSGIIRNRARDGKYYLVQSAISPLRNRAGAISSYLSIRFDVTRLEEAERRITEEEEKLICTAQLVTLGEMAASVVHEINNTLAVIHAQALMSQRKFGDVPGVAPAFAKIEATALRASTIVKGISKFARGGQDLPPEPCHVASMLNSVRDLCHERVTKSGIDFRISGGSPTVAVLANPVQLSQVLVNLVNNSVDAILGVPHEASSAWIEMSATQVVDNAEIRVTDSGPGVPASIRSRLMTPFFTTKAPGKGTGLGLSISKNIVAAHKGHFYLDDAAQHTTFVVALPVMTPAQILATQKIATSEAAPVELAPRKRMVLVLDDEPDMSELMAEEVRALGMLATETVTVSQAKERILQGGIDVVLTDYRLAGENGLDLAKWITEQHGGQPRCIVVSGGFDGNLDMVAHSPGVVGTLHKPMSIVELKVALSRAIDLSSAA